MEENNNVQAALIAEAEKGQAEIEAAVQLIMDKVDTAEDLCAVGKMCLQGKYPAMLEPVSYLFFTKAAMMGSAEGMYLLGVCYVRGVGGVLAEYEPALEWLKKALEGGCEDAREMVKLLESPQGPVALLTVATMADGQYGKCWYRSRVMVDGFYERAEAGDAECQYELARQLADPRHIGEFSYDIEKAIYWYTRAGENGVVDAMFNLAKIYWLGSQAPKGFVGYAPDLAKAKEWFSRCAAAGDAEAASILETHFRE